LLVLLLAGTLSGQEHSEGASVQLVELMQRVLRRPPQSLQLWL
jgi:hypothetical protein